MATMASTGWAGDAAGGIGLYLVGLALIGEGLAVTGGGLLAIGPKGRNGIGHLVLRGLGFGLFYPSSSASTDAQLALPGCGRLGARACLPLLVGIALAAGIPAALLGGGAVEIARVGLIVIATGAFAYLGTRTPATRTRALCASGFGMLLLGSGTMLAGFSALPGGLLLDGFTGIGATQGVFGLLCGALLAALFRAPSLVVAIACGLCLTGHVELTTALGACAGSSLGILPRLREPLRSSRELRQAAVLHVFAALFTCAIATAVVTLGLSGLVGAHASAWFIGLFLSAVAALGTGLCALLPVEEMAERLRAEEDPGVPSLFFIAPAIALELAEREVASLAESVQRVSRGLLRGEGATRFRIDETRRAVDEASLRLGELEAGCLGRPTTTLVRSALDRATDRARAWAEILERTLQLTQVQPVRAQAIDSGLSSRLRQVEYGIFHLLEGCALDARGAPGTRERDGEVRTVEGHLAEIERRLLSAEPGRTSPTDLQGLIWRIEMLRGLAHQARAAA